MCGLYRAELNVTVIDEMEKCGTAELSCILKGTLPLLTKSVKSWSQSENGGSHGGFSKGKESGI
jgi:hypothetical protein